MRRARWLAILGHAPFTVLCCPSCFVPICICSAAFHVEGTLKHLESMGTQQLGSLSAASQIDFPSGFLLLCHLHLPKTQVCSVTDYETHHILRWQLQGRCAHRTINPKGQVSWEKHSYPTHLWYPTSSCPAWHPPALPGCREQPWVCSTFLLPAQESVGVSRRKQGVQSRPTINMQHCCFLTHISQ